MKNIYLDKEGNQIKTATVYYQNGADDQDAEEVLLSDSEKFENIFDDEPLDSPIY